LAQAEVGAVLGGWQYYPHGDPGRHASETAARHTATSAASATSLQTLVGRGITAKHFEVRMSEALMRGTLNMAHAILAAAHDAARATF